MRTFGVGVLMVWLTACGGEAVGAPCAPEHVPEGGFDEQESYIEVGSPQCETHVCLVHQLDGDLESPGAEDHIYCSCRCGAGENQDCECPDGFACREVLGLGKTFVAGSYCVRSR